MTDKTQSDRAAFHAMLSAAIARIDAIGPAPVGARGPLGRRAHPDAEVWEQKVAAAGREFFLSAREAAKSGNATAAGYVADFATDATAADYATTKIDARWALALRAI